MRRTMSEEESHEPLALAQNRLNERRVGPREFARRRSLLHDDPNIEVVNMATLVAIANAIEEESVRRYTQLAELMDRRGEPATAAAFRVMLEEERGHVTAVQRWSASLSEPVQAAEAFEWELPADLSSSWDDIARSALLTPYRAFAMAVENEERAFSFYAYLAAHAENSQISAEAEKLGAEELRHASLLRRFRRRAYHRDRQPPPEVPLEIESIEQLRHVVAQHEEGIAQTYGALARRLERAGDAASANFLEGLIATPSRPPSRIAASSWASGSDVHSGVPLAADHPRHLLVDAQKPLELLADTLEKVMAEADGELFEEAASAMQSVVDRMAKIAMQISSSSEARGT